MAACGAQAPLCPAVVEAETPCLALLSLCRATLRASMELPASATRSPGADCVTGLAPEESAAVRFPGAGFARDKATWAGTEFPWRAVLSLPQPMTFVRAGSVFLARGGCSVKVGVRGIYLATTAFLFHLLPLASNGLQLLT